MWEIIDYYGGLYLTTLYNIQKIAYTYRSLLVIHVSFNICLHLFKLEHALNKFKTHKYVKHCEMYKVEICFWYNYIIMAS